MNQIHTILIANRAEVAVRVIRACREEQRNGEAGMADPGRGR
ncbi:hypothetical protein H5A00_08685 [Campylobacter jejuni]|nr:hypothetical protein [Campylobacter jejuni]